MSTNYSSGHKGWLAIPLAERVWPRVSIGPAVSVALGPCWLWGGKRNDKGYGQIEVDRRNRRATHAVLFLLTGRWPSSLVLHRCDTPSCVRPSHLYKGTQADNQREMSAKGRSANQRKTHCPAGHPYDASNTIIRASGWRQCRVCSRRAQLH